MSGTISRDRKAADIAFERTQSQFIARTRALNERNSEIEARNENTRRLREARLARELVDKLAAAKSKARMPAGSSRTDKA